MSSANRISQEWEEEQRRREAKREQERLRQTEQEVSTRSGAQQAAAPSTTTSRIGYPYHSEGEGEVASERPLNAEDQISSSQDEAGLPVEDGNISGFSGPDAPEVVEAQDQVLADVSGGSGEPGAVADSRVGLGSARDSSSSHDDPTEAAMVAVGTAEAQGGEHEPKAQTRDSGADVDDRRRDEVDLENDGGATSRGGGWADGDGVVAAAALSGALLGSSVDDIDYLLDKSDTESSQDDGNGRRRSHHGDPEEDGLSHGDTSNGTDGCSEDEDVEQATIIPWAVSRIGMLEKVRPSTRHYGQQG